MNIIIIAALFVAGISAMPSSDHHIVLSNRVEENNVQHNAQPFFLGPIISSLVYSYISSIPNPYISDLQDYDIVVPDGSSFVHAHVNELYVAGLNTVNIERMTTPLIPTRVNFKVVVPSITICVGPTTVFGLFAGHTITSDGSGCGTFEHLTVEGQAPISVSITGAITVRSVDARVTVRKITADAVGRIEGIGSSNDLNYFLNNELGPFINENSDQFNALLYYIILEFLSG